MPPEGGELGRGAADEGLARSGEHLPLVRRDHDVHIHPPRGELCLQFGEVALLACLTSPHSDLAIEHGSACVCIRCVLWSGLEELLDLWADGDLSVRLGLELGLGLGPMGT